MTSGVEFEEDNLSRSYGKTNSSAQGFSSSTNNYQGYGESDVRGMAGWLIRRGIVKSQQGAQLMLVGVIIFNLIVTAVFITIFL